MNDKRSPRPVLRAMALGVPAGVVVGAARAWDLATAKSPPESLPLAVVAAAIWALAAGIAAGVAGFLQGRKDLEDLRIAQNAASDAATMRDTLVAALWTAADAQRELIGAVTSVIGNPDEAVGRFQQVITDTARLAAEVVHPQEDIQVRTGFFRYNPESDDSSAADGAFRLVAVSGGVLDYAATNESEFAAAARELMESGDTVIAEGAAAGSMVLPGAADFYARLPVVAGDHSFGVLVVDVWAADSLREADLQAVQGLVNLLSGGLAVLAAA